MTLTYLTGGLSDGVPHCSLTHWDRPCGFLRYTLYVVGL